MQKKDSLKKIAIKGFAWGLIDKFVNQLAYILVSVYLARLIGPEGYGLIGMLAIFMAVANSLMDGGLLQALIQRSHQMTEVEASTVFYVNIGIGLTLYALIYVAAPWIAGFYKQPELTPITRALFTVIIINSFTVVVQAKLTINIDFKSLALASTVATVFSAAIAFGLAHEGYGYWALIWQNISRTFIVAIGLWKLSNWRPKLVFSGESFRSLFKFGSNLMAAGLIATVVNNLYSVLIGRFYNAAQVGYFTQATSLSNYFSQFVSSSIQGVTYPLMTSIKEDRERLARAYKQLVSITMFFSLPILIGFAAIAADFVSFFLGESWLPMVPVLMMLCLARTVTPISAINMNILNAVGRSDLFLKVDLSKLPMTLGTLIFAIPYGIEGLSKAMVVTSFIAFFMNAYFPGKLFGFGGLAQIKIAKNYIFASFIMFLVVTLIPGAPSFYLIFLKIVSGVIVYIMVLWALADSVLNRLAADSCSFFRRYHK